MEDLKKKTKNPADSYVEVEKDKSNITYEVFLTKGERLVSNGNNEAVLILRKC